MNDNQRTTLLISSLVGVASAAFCWIGYRRANASFKATKTKGSVSVHPDLQAHSHTFDQQVIRINGTNVYVAIGFALANSIMIEGEDGIIIIDTTEALSSAKAVLDAFRTITAKPIVAIIYTHFHHDHVGGTEIFLDEVAAQGRPAPPIWAHDTTAERIAHFNSIMGPIAYYRAAKMFGTYLEKPVLENCGIGAFLKDAKEVQGHDNFPTHCYTGRKSISIAGIDLELIHAPGETEDQTVVFMPKHKILFAADNYYASFPNLYTIRGAPHRDVIQWAASIDTMIETNPDVLVPSHTLPVYGKEEICTRLQNYRDAIQYVHDQTVRLMLKNYHPDEIAAEIELPSNLRDCEYLKQFYGTTGWSAKAIFTGYMGWYSGDECDLYKLTPPEYADRMIDLAGGNDSVLEKALEAFDKQDYQWALELSSAILRAKINKASRNVRNKARELKTKCCIQLAEREISAPGRNWYMTSAKINEENLNIRLPDKVRKNAFSQAPLKLIFDSLCVRFAPSKSMEGVRKSMSFIIIDDNEESGWTLSTRNSVMYAKNEADDSANIVIETTDKALRDLFANPKSIATNILSKNFVVKKGDITTFLQFIGHIDTDM